MRQHEGESQGKKLHHGMDPQSGKLVLVVIKNGYVHPGAALSACILFFSCCVRRTPSLHLQMFKDVLNQIDPFDSLNVELL